MTVATGDVLEVVAKMEFDDTEDVLNIYQFQNAGGVINSDNDAIDDILDILEDIYTPYLGAQGELYTYRAVKIRNITQGTLLGEFPWPSLTAGTNVSDALPPGVALVLNLGTVVARVVLRKYFGGFAEGSNEVDGTWGSALVAFGVATIALLTTEFAETNSTWLYGTLSPKTLGFETPVGGIVTNIPGYQRRRKQGRGS